MCTHDALFAVQPGPLLVRGHCLTDVCWVVLAVCDTDGCEDDICL